jgi:hypothetical protein
MMDSPLTSAVLVLLGSIVGAAAGVVGQILTARYTNKGERRRLAMETVVAVRRVLEARRRELEAGLSSPSAAVGRSSD